MESVRAETEKKGKKGDDRNKERKRIKESGNKHDRRGERESKSNQVSPLVLAYACELQLMDSNCG